MESKMKAKNELNGTDKAVSDNQTVVQVVADSASVDVYGNTVTLREGGTNSPYYDGF